jgi:S1-C subfamily serine protease
MFTACLSRRNLLRISVRLALALSLTVQTLSACTDSPIPSQIPSPTLSSLTLPPQVVVIGAEGCGLVPRIASGFRVRAGVVVTAAHTLRGAKTVTVDQVVVSVLAMDHRSDVAVLAEPGVDSATSIASDTEVFSEVALGPAVVRKPIRMAQHDSLRSAVVLQPVRVRTVAPIEIEEPLDKTTYRRNGFVFEADSGSIVSGDSGSPVVDEQQRLIGMVFAAGRGNASTAYAVSASEIQQVMDSVETERGKTAPVSTGTC